MSDEILTRRRPQTDPASLLWHILVAPQTLMVLLGLLACALSLQALLPQIPAEGIQDPEAWLAVDSGVPGQVGGLLYLLGLFDVAHAFWFRLLLVVVALTLLVRLVDSAHLAWIGTRRGRWTAADFVHWGRFAPQLLISASGPVGEVALRLRGLLADGGYQVAEVQGQTSRDLVASRRAWSLWAEPGVHAGLLALLIGLGILTTWGWQISDWQPGLGEVRPVGHGTPYAVRLDRFDLAMDEDGRLKETHGDITWLENGVERRHDQVSLGRAASLGGVALRQVGYAPIVRIRGRETAGQSLLFQASGQEQGASAEVEVSFPVPDAEPLVLIYGHDLFLALTFEQLSQEGKPSLHIALAAQGDATPTPLAVLHTSGDMALDGGRLAVALEYRPILRVDRRPGAGVALAGGALALAAMLAGLILPPRLVWIVSGEDEQGLTWLRLLAFPQTRGLRWPVCLASRLREETAGNG